MVTIKDVARLAGVSQATVSHVMNGTRNVLPATRKKVERVMLQTGYRPSAAARHLSGGATRMIGLIVSSIQLPLNALLYREIDRRLRPAGYSVWLRNVDEDPVLEATTLDQFIRHRIDGAVVISNGEHLPEHDALLRSGRPLVFVDRRPKGLDAPLVALDSAAAARRGTEHLLAHGHRRIALLTREINREPFTARARGYRTAMTKAGLAPRIIQVGSPTGRSRIEAAACIPKLLAEAEPPTALLVGSNAVTMGTLQGLHDCGGHCPRDLSLVCFDSSPWSEFVDPALTVLEHPVEAVAEAAVQALLEGLQAQTRKRLKRGHDNTQLFEARLIERASVAHLPC
ncbi:MAG: LacI family transcriptional regulator [Thermoflexales bacterium]|nr:LacI family transcriptional regulator [Thermoflexales bacterium]